MWGGCEKKISFFSGEGGIFFTFYVKGRGLALRVFTLCVYGLFVGGGFIIEVSKGERLFDGLSALRSSRDSEAVV